MRVLVTGGMGFIGSALCRRLARDAGTRVVNVDKVSYASVPASLADIEDYPNYRFVRADICDGDAMLALMRRERIEHVMHLAAESHVDRSIEGPAEFIRSNIEGSYALLEALRAYRDGLPEDGVKTLRYLHVSTDEVYGSLGLDAPPFNESTPYDPRSPYSASKAASDHLAKAWSHTYGLPIVLSNCSNNYGPHQFPEKLIPLTILNAVHEERLPVYGDGRNVRDWLYVEDHVSALIAVVQNGAIGDTYNIGARNEVTNIEIVRAICAELDELRPRASGAPYADLISYVKDRPGHDFRYAIDPAKLERELGWRAEIDFAEGLRRTVQWYLQNEPWWRPIRDARYSGQRLGLLAHEQK
ncbi:MAG: dTDP-glucose 4,6-dehydratase [Hyphomonadaceae bacterium JAD_PAG50586_4]|nr:MAG: dTDP-glucose 4,6-dehydratase [Hyphomonadaceae bacterium JAD_PAG50586_4]